MPKTHRIPWIPLCYVAPAVLVMSLALLYPVLQAVHLALYDWALGTPWSSARFQGLQAFSEALRHPQMWASAGITLAFTLCAVSLEMILGLSIALLLLAPARGLQSLRTLFVLPMMLSPICVGLIWRYMFDASFGPINHLFGWIGLPTPAWLAVPHLAFIGIIVADVWQWTPFVFLLLLAGLQGQDNSLIEAARIDGANAWQVFTKIRLPLLRPVLIVTLLMRMIDAFRNLEVVYILTFGGPGQSTELFPLHIYKAAFISQQIGYASALSVLLLIAVGLLSAGVLYLSNPLKKT